MTTSRDTIIGTVVMVCVGLAFAAILTGAIGLLAAVTAVSLAAWAWGRWGE